MPSDVFPTLFGALRDRLAVHVSACGSVKALVPAGAYQVPSDALLASLSASDRSIVQEIRHDEKLQLLRRKRLGVRKMREVKRTQKQRLEVIAAAECDMALQEASTHDQKFQYFLTETHAKAAARLQILFSECIAEMKKALNRMESVAADVTEESESMVKELLRGYEWQLFLTRLQQDCGGDVEASLLIPSPSRSKSNNRPLESGQITNSNASVKAVLKKVLQEHGPALGNVESLAVRSAMALCKTGSLRRASDKYTPSLHFGASAADMLTEVVGDMMCPQNHTKPRRSTSSSARRIRRLPPSKGATTAISESTPVFTTDDGVCSSFRQLATGTPQFPSSACDIPLSSVYIQWMFTNHNDSVCKSNDTSGNGWWQYREVVDSNVYFNIAEYEQNFAAIMQNYAASAVMDDTSATDHTVMASARRCLREVNAILERSRERKETYSADTIFARAYRSNQSKDTDGGFSVFARASVLQLVQTLYYSKCFLALLPPADVDTLRNLYPTTLFGEGCLSTLYVPVIDGVRNRVALEEEEESTAPVGSSSKVFMLALDNHAIHELLLIYVARGRRVLIPDPSSQLTSLALSDAVSTLVPCYQMDSNQRSAPYCVIKNPWGLWKQDKGTGEQAYSGALQRLRGAGIIFVECTVTNLEDVGPEPQSVRALHTKSPAVLEMLGGSCMWRSCITSRESHGLQSGSNLCLWHTFVQNFLEAGESVQYIPNESHMREALQTADSESAAEKTKRVIQTSSLLLEELSSRHLPQSINAFYDHVVSAASNRAYQAEFLDARRLGGSANGKTSIRELEQAHHELQHFIDLSEEIVDTENCVTRELRQLLQLTVYPGVADSFVQHGFFDLEELQSDIRTRDLELLLRLSQQKLQILRRRRKDEENQVTRRLAPSSSLPSMRVYSALEQAGLDDSGLVSSSVYDVIHVMRKGRQSLLRQQQDGRIHNGSNPNDLPTYSLERCASDVAYQVSPYEAKVAPIARYRTKGGTNGKRPARKNSNR